MKKVLSTLVVAAVIALGTINAQGQVFKKGNINYSIGLGVVPTFFADNATIKTPPLSLRVGYSISDHFNLNAYVGYSSTTSAMIPDASSNGYRQYNNDFLMLGLRGEFHAMKTDKLDIYGGFMLGYNKSFVNDTFFPGEGDSETDAPINNSAPLGQEDAKILYSGFVGATYFVGKKVGIFGELGYGVSLMNFGVTFKL